MASKSDTLWPNRACPAKAGIGLRVLRVMLCAVLCWCLFCASAWAQETSGISFRFQDEPLSNVLKKWKKEYRLRCAYDPSLCEDLSVTAEGTDLSPQEALTQVLEKTELTWKLIGTTYAIYRKPPAENVTPTRAGVSFGSRVLDYDTREPIAFASVRVSGTTTGATTDDEGRFFLRSIPADTSTLIVSYVGYQVLRQKLTPATFESREPLFISRSFGLMPQAIVYGDQTGLIQSSAQAGLMEVSTLDLSSIGSAGEPDAMKAAQLLPGVDATTENSGGLMVRGTEPDQSRVTMDGFTLYHLDHFFGLYSAFNPLVVESVRVHKGHAPLSEGGFTGGWVEMVSRDGNRKKNRSRIDLGLLTVAACTEGPIGTKGSYFIAARRAYTDALFSPLFQSLFNSLYNANIPEVDAGQVDVFEGESAPNFGFFDVNAKFTFYPGERDRVSLSLMRSVDRLDMNFIQSLDAVSQQVIFSDQSQWGNTGASLRWNHHWTDSVHSEIQLAGSAFNSELFSQDIIRDLLTGATTSARSEEENLLSDFSGKFTHHNYIGPCKLLSGLQLSLYESRHNTLAEFDTSGAILAAGFTEISTASAFGLEFSGGLRLSHFSRTGAPYLDPRLNLIQSLSNNRLHLKLSFNASHQFLQRLQPQNFALNNPDYWQLSDGEDLPVMRGNQLSMGANWSHGGWTFDGELFGRRTQGLKRRFVNVMGMGDQLIDGTGQSAGFDLLVQRDLGRHHFWLASTTSFSFLSLDDEARTEIPESSYQWQELKFIYQVKLDRVDISAAWFFGSGKPFTPLLGTYTLPLLNGDEQVLPVFGSINSDRLPAYHRLDVSITYRFSLDKAEGSLSMNLFNVYDRSNIRNFQYFAISGDETSFAAGSRAVGMLGFAPSLNFSISF